MRCQRIKIFAPIDKPEEFLPLAKAGADEFFCGVLFNGASLSSRRTSDITDHNLPDFEALEDLAKLVKADGKKIYIALNIPRLSYSQMTAIKKAIPEFTAMGVSGLILGNLNLIYQLKNCNLDIVASSFFEVKNEEVVRMLKNLGVKRIIFDRQITENDLINIIPKFPGMEFEAFILSSGCRSLVSGCLRESSKKKYSFTVNNYPYHLCLSDYSVSRDKNPFLSRKSKELIARRLIIDKSEKYKYDESGNFYLRKSCGACALWQFRKRGITSVKIVGRGYHVSLKIQLVKFIKKSLDALEEEYSAIRFYRKVEKLFEETFGFRCARRDCYYPHFFVN